jgi:hypothetical protein
MGRFWAFVGDWDIMAEKHPGEHGQEMANKDDQSSERLKHLINLGEFYDAHFEQNLTDEPVFPFF